MSVPPAATMAGASDEVFAAARRGQGTRVASLFMRLMLSDGSQPAVIQRASRAHHRTNVDSGRGQVQRWNQDILGQPAVRIQACRDLPNRGGERDQGQGAYTRLVRRADDRC